MRAANAILLVVVACISLSFAQQSGRTTGIVVDPNGSRVVGATIRIENADFKRTKRSDSEGRFELEAPSGTYELTVEQSGFKKFRVRDFRVGTGTREFNIKLEVATPPSPVKVVPGS